MRFNFRLSNVIIIAVAVVILVVGLVLAYSVVTKSGSQEKDDVSIADSSAEQTNDPSAEINDEESVIPDNTGSSVPADIENNVEPQTSEELQDDSLQYIAWQFLTYVEPDFKTATLASLPPSNVQIVERREDGWAKIDSGGGTSWVFLDKNLFYIDRWVSLYSGIGDENALDEDLAPQIVEIIDQKDRNANINGIEKFPLQNIFEW